MISLILFIYLFIFFFEENFPYNSRCSKNLRYRLVYIGRYILDIGTYVQQACNRLFLSLPYSLTLSLFMCIIYLSTNPSISLSIYIYDHTYIYIKCILMYIFLCTGCQENIARSLYLHRFSQFCQYCPAIKTGDFFSSLRRYCTSVQFNACSVRLLYQHTEQL